MITDKDVADLNARIDTLLAEIKEIKASVNQRYSWEEKATDSGIQLTGGPTTATHIGVLKSVTAVPTPQGIAILFVLKDEKSNRFAVLPPELVKPV